MDVQQATVDPPPASTPRPATDLRSILGRRVTVCRYDDDTGIPQYVTDHRAASEVFTDGDRRLYVRVVTEAAWYAWMSDTGPKPGRCPRAVAVPAYLVFVD